MAPAPKNYVRNSLIMIGSGLFGMFLSLDYENTLPRYLPESTKVHMPYPYHPEKTKMGI